MNALLSAQECAQQASASANVIAGLVGIAGIAGMCFIFWAVSRP